MYMFVSAQKNDNYREQDWLQLIKERNLLRKWNSLSKYRTNLLGGAICKCDKRSDAILVEGTCSNRIDS